MKVITSFSHITFLWENKTANFIRRISQNLSLPYNVCHLQSIVGYVEKLSNLRIISAINATVLLLNLEDYSTK